MAGGSRCAAHRGHQQVLSPRDRAVDVGRPDGECKRLGPAEYAFYTAPTEWIPTDGIVRDTARGIVRGREQRR